MCEGIKIRSRIEERLDGENISNFLLGKEKNARSSITKLLTENGTCINNTKAIEINILDYCRKLFKEQSCDFRIQEAFLDLMKCVIGQNESNILTADVTESEIWRVVNSMKNGKAPGLDGLPLEFYKEMWNVIKEQFIIIVKYMLTNMIMGKDMNKGVIKLVPKSNDTISTLDNLRPITMLNVDYKIVAKIIANRMRQVLHLFISPEQFCGVPEKSISNCNTLIRDIMYYINQENLPAALINLDWSKAFDRVNQNVICKILERLGFSPIFIGMIEMLYCDAKSVICISGNLSELFSIMKSVRQGCPLSMMLFIIAQEPLYRMM